MYKVGDYVRIRNDLENRLYINNKGEVLSAVNPMLRYRGRTTRITEVIEPHPNLIGDMIPVSYRLSLEDGWQWSDEMLVPANNSIGVLLEKRNEYTSW